MDRIEMIKRLDAGKKPIDLSIQKWIDIRDGKGKDDSARNCACCYISISGGCTTCPIDLYDKVGTQYGTGGMCNEIRRDTYKNKDKVLEFIRYMKKVRTWMKKEGRY